MNDKQYDILLKLLNKCMQQQASGEPDKWCSYTFTPYISFRCYMTIVDCKKTYVFFLILPKHHRNVRLIENRKDMVKKLRQFEDAKEFSPLIIEKYLMERT